MVDSWLETNSVMAIHPPRYADEQTGKSDAILERYLSQNPIEVLY
jgi:hypothetical protein